MLGSGEFKLVTPLLPRAIQPWKITPRTNLPQIIIVSVIALLTLWPSIASTQEPALEEAGVAPLTAAEQARLLRFCR